jgi:hypothetical protein
VCADDPPPVRECELSSGPACGGICPQGYQCQTSGALCICVPEAVSCAGSSAPSCVVPAPPVSSAVPTPRARPALAGRSTWHVVPPPLPRATERARRTRSARRPLPDPAPASS